MIIWSFNPIDIDARMYDYIAKTFQIAVINYYSNGKMPEERRECGYDAELDNFRRIHVNEEEAVEILTNTYGEINVFFGLLYSLNRKLINILKTRKNENKVCIISERYNAFGTFAEKRLKEVIRFYQYRKLSKQIGKLIDCFFAYGTKGVRYFERCGFTSLYPLIYATNFQEGGIEDKSNSAPSAQIDRKHITRFVYVGRFEFDLKGVDILLKVLEKLSGGVNTRTGILTLLEVMAQTVKTQKSGLQIIENMRQRSTEYQRNM